MTCFTLTCLTASASTGLEKINRKISDLIMESKTLEVSSGLCTGWATVINSSGKQESIKMTSFEAVDATECSDKYLAWAKGLSTKYPKVIELGSNYTESNK